MRAVLVDSNVLLDAVLGCPLVTRDPGIYREYFPKLELVAPSEQG